MLDTLRQFIADLVSPTAIETRAFDEADYRLAATALLVHVISLDGAPTEVEKRKLHSLLETSMRRHLPIAAFIFPVFYLIPRVSSSGYFDLFRPHHKPIRFLLEFYSENSSDPRGPKPFRRS